MTIKINKIYNTPKKDWVNIGFLALICIIAYWPVSFNIFSLKNDALNFFLPVRWQISEAIHSGYFPFWSSYLNLGYPLHGDMQSGVWNPFVWLFSIAGPYTLYMLQLETILYVFLSGAGIYLFFKYLNILSHTNLMCSTAYMLSGFVIDSSQFLNWIAAAAFLPFIILLFLRTINEKKIQYSILTGLFFYLMLVCAYPAFFIMISYVCLLILVWHIYKNRSDIKKLIVSVVIIIVTFITFSLPAIISYLQFMQFSYRGSGTLYSDAMSNGMNPFFLLSYIFPLPVFRSYFGTGTDPLGRDSYTGIITLLFGISLLFHKSGNSWVKFCKWGLLISLIFSFGKPGIIRPLTYYILPLMDTFRHPSSTRVFSIFFMCCLSAFTLNRLIKGNKIAELTKVYKYVTGAFVIISLWSVIKLSAKYINGAQATLQFDELLVINSIIQVPFLYVFYKWGIIKNQWKFVSRAGIINSLLIAALLMPFPVVKNTKASKVQEILSEASVTGYPLPDLNKSIKENSAGDSTLFNEIGPLNMYTKKVGRNNYYISPSNLLSQKIFWSDTVLRNQIMNKPLIYTESSTTITPIDFNPGQIAFKVSNDQPAEIILLQNFYPNWKASVDGKAEQIFKVKTSFMGIKLKSGTHNVVFKYKPQIIVYAFWISTISLLLTILFLIRKCLFTKDSPGPILHTYGFE